MRLKIKFQNVLGILGRICKHTVHCTGHPVKAAVSRDVWQFCFCLKGTHMNRQKRFRQLFSFREENQILSSENHCAESNFLTSYPFKS